MSFFNRNNSDVKGLKRKLNTKFKNFNQSLKFSKKIVKYDNDNESISSTDEEFTDKNNHYENGREQDETVQEKRLRLAKQQLELLEQEEKDREEFEERSDVRLKEKLKKINRYKESVSSNIVNYKDPHFLLCKDHKDSVTCMCLSSDANFLYSGSKNGSIVKWSLSNKFKVASLNSRSFEKNSYDKLKSIRCLAISTDNKFLVFGSEKSNDIRVHNTMDLGLIKKLQGHKDIVSGLVFRKNTHTLYSASMDRSVKVWNLDDMTYVESFFGHQAGITSIDSLFNERAITSGGFDGTIRIWKIVDESQLIYNGHGGTIDAVKLINEENFLSGGSDGQLCIWSSAKKKPLCTVLEAHGKDDNGLPMWICSIATLLNTDLVASGSMNGKINFWKCGANFRSLTLLFSVTLAGCINSLIFTPDGKNLIAAVGKEHRLGRWWKVCAKNSIAVIPLEKYR